MSSAHPFAEFLDDVDPIHRRALEIGKAAEHLVCADLILAGHRAFLSDQGLPYDVVIDHGGTLFRVQVKSTMGPKNANAKGRSPNHVYCFDVKRRGKGNKGARLSKNDCDIIALVALDTKQIAYFHFSEVGQTMALYPSNYTFPGNFQRSRMVSIDGFPFARALQSCL